MTTNRGGAMPRAEIPRTDYHEFYKEVVELLSDRDYHVGHYFGVPIQEGLEIYCILLRDSTGEIMIASHLYGYYADTPLESLTAVHPQFHPFEREISELYAIVFRGNPWDKPLRFAHDRANKSNIVEKYDFYRMDGESLHEVNVGPIHAGIIEPGAFRFICNGEQVIHLEIALGYQHRGVEGLMAKGNGLRRALLCESVAGDSAVGHASAYAMAVEKLSSGATYIENVHLWKERTIALELERIAMHIADVSALCADIGYQLGQVACEAIRTVVINTTQAWCGNRFGKTLVRPLGTNYPLTDELAVLIENNINMVRRKFSKIRANLKSTPSVLARFEQCGIVPVQEMGRIGGVGMAARASGFVRDIRSSHPWGMFSTISHEPHSSEFGDVMARLTMRMREVLQSADLISGLLADIEPEILPKPAYESSLSPDSLALGLLEGWRGEICHAAITDRNGAVVAYKIKDPSIHNWLALALAVRGEGISDFPICNKSFNLSYCGHDL